MPASREKLTGERLGEPSSVVSARVEAARERQHRRFASADSRVHCNADVTPADMWLFCGLDATGQSLVRPATRSEQLQLSAGAFHRVLTIARTIADLAENEDIAPAHLAEAIHLRPTTKVGANASNCLSYRQNEDARNRDSFFSTADVLYLAAHTTGQERLSFARPGPLPARTAKCLIVIPIGSNLTEYIDFFDRL